MTDIYAALVRHLGDQGQVVYVEIPHNAPLGTLPCIDLQPAGPDSHQGGFNNLGGDLVGIDVGLYVPHAYWADGRAEQHAQALRHHLMTLRMTDLAVVDVSRPRKFPDRNEHIRHLGMTATIAVKA